MYQALRTRDANYSFQLRHCLVAEREGGSGGRALLPTSHPQAGLRRLFPQLPGVLATHSESLPRNDSPRTECLTHGRTCCSGTGHIQQQVDVGTMA